MGDEELNFTEEEARPWANDPRNQAHRGGAAVGIVIVCILILVTLIVAASSGHSKSDGSQINIGTLFVL